MRRAKLPFERTTNANGDDTGRIEIRAQHPGHFDVAIRNRLTQGDARAGGDEEIGCLQVVLGETRAGTQFQTAHRFDEPGFDFAFEDEVVAHDRTGLDDALGGHADGAGGLERAAPAIVYGVVGEVERGAAFVAVGLRGASGNPDPAMVLSQGTNRD